MLSFARQVLIDGAGSKFLPAKEKDAVVSFIQTYGQLLDEWPGPMCLVHCDFGGSNIIVRTADDGWQVACIIDWEFAAAGKPYFDFGNLLRPPVGNVSSFAEGVKDGYLHSGGKLPERWREASLLADLFAWLEFLTRKTVPDALVADCRQRMEYTISAIASQS